MYNQRRKHSRDDSVDYQDKRRRRDGDDVPHRDDDSRSERTHDRRPNPNNHNDRTFGRSINNTNARNDRGSVSNATTRPQSAQKQQSLDDNLSVSKPEIKELYTKPDVMNRNKRLFGSLMGHLGLAKQNLEKDSQAIRIQNERKQAVTDKHVKESKRLELLRKEEIRKKIYEQKMNVLNGAYHAWKDNADKMCNVLLTSTVPKLSWLPAHHNKRSKEILQVNKKEMLKKIAEKEEEYQRKVHEIEQKFGEHSNFVHKQDHDHDVEEGDDSHAVLASDDTIAVEETERDQKVKDADEQVEDVSETVEKKDPEDKLPQNDPIIEPVQETVVAQQQEEVKIKIPEEAIEVADIQISEETPPKEVQQQDVVVVTKEEEEEVVMAEDVPVVSVNNE